MSEAIAFDTHRFVKRLTENGFTVQQAEALAEEQVALLNANLATKAAIETLRQETKGDMAQVKADIEALRQETKADMAQIKADIEALRQETKADMAQVKADIEALRLATKTGIETLRQETKAGIEAVKTDLLKWLFGALIAQTGLIVTLIKLL